jgi:TolA-binding protein
LLIQTILPPDEPDDVVLARVARSLRRQRPRALGARPWFRLALAALALLAGVATVKAFEWVREAGLVGPAPVAPTRPTTGRRAQHTAGVRPARVPTDEAMPASIPLAPVPTSVASPSSAPAARAVSASRPRPVPAATRPSRVTAQAAQPAPSSSTTSIDEPPAVPAPGARPSPSTAVAAVSAATEEVVLLDRAVALLRRHHDAAGALAAFEAYLHRYPHGLLQREALSGRIDALLLLGRSAQALSALDAFPFDQHRRSTELQVIRGELRARTDCARAADDFTDALGRGPDAPLLERILYGRGACRAKLGDRGGAEADLRRYVERFPAAEHASRVRRWLDGGAGAPP